MHLHLPRKGVAYVIVSYVYVSIYPYNIHITHLGFVMLLYVVILGRCAQQGWITGKGVLRNSVYKVTPFLE